MKTLEKFLAGVIIGGTVMFILITFTSCGAPKYGCGRGAPKQSWNRMVQRINSFN